MSDDRVHMFPAEAGTGCNQDNLQDAVAYFRTIAPTAVDVKSWASDHLDFIHCGANFGMICCPTCGREIDAHIWGDWMELGSGENGFTLTQHSMQCCATQHTLHELVYEWPQGFSRCGVSAMNPNIGEVSEEQRKRFELILGCPVRVIYEHL